jgi:hypothetical protein
MTVAAINGVLAADVAAINSIAAAAIAAVDGVPFSGGAVASTWNSADKDSDVTLSGADLIASVTYPSGLGGVRATNPRDAALNRFAEVVIAGTDINQFVGLATVASSLLYPGADSSSTGLSISGNGVYFSGSPSTYFPAHSTVVGVLVDFTAGTLTFRRSGQFYTHAFSGVSGTLYPSWGPGTSGTGARTGTLNASGPFTLGLPPGATAWGGTWNPADKNADITLSGSDLIATSNASLASVRGTQGRSSGKYYFELTAGGPDQVSLGGAANASASLSTYPGGDANGYGFFYFNSTTYPGGGAMPAQVTTLPVGIWLDAGVLKFVIENQVGPNAWTGLSGDYYPMWAANTTANGTRTGTLNVSTFVNDLPSGATAWG